MQDSLIQLERAISELKRGQAVVINGNTLLLASETTTPATLHHYQKLYGQASLILSAKRLSHMLDQPITTAQYIILNKTSNIDALVASFPITEKLDPSQLKAIDEVQQAGLLLTKYAELLPSLISFDIQEAPEQVITLRIEDITNYPQNSADQLEEVARTHFPTRYTDDCELIAFRHPASMREHYAIIIGKPNETPLLRLHSSCYTGDLLESLACDCHDQLHSAILHMAENGGGIILYMLQEGRGIGLVNKLRAYAVKAQGKDTVDANEILGFDDDERAFLPAASIIKKLGIKEVQLLTNNPRKAEGLKHCGIKVPQCVPHEMDSNIHNEAYLQTKRERLGHQLTPKEPT